MKNKYDILLKLQGKMRSGMLGENVVFHHVPKCGGTSLNRALRLRYMLSQRPIMANSSAKAIPPFFPGIESDPIEFHRQVHLFRKQMLHYYMSADIAFLTGHVGFCSMAYEKHHQRYRFITVLRHPVDRFISDFLDLSVRGASFYKTDLSIDDYLGTDEAAIRANTLGVYFSSSLKRATDLDDQDYRDARENLGKFDLVGFVDSMAQFNQTLNSLLGVKIRIGHENRSQASSTKKRELFSDAILEKINALCERDIDLYQAVRRSPGQ